MFIKLTQHPSKQPIYLRSDIIVAVTQRENSSAVESEKELHFVAESAEEVMALIKPKACEHYFVQRAVGLHKCVNCGTEKMDYRGSDSNFL